MKKSNEKGKINMKKMIAFLLAAVMLLSLAACGGGVSPQILRRAPLLPVQARQPAMQRKRILHRRGHRRKSGPLRTVS